MDLAVLVVSHTVLFTSNVSLLVSLQLWESFKKNNKKKNHHSKLFMLNSQICKSYRRSESKYYFFLLKASLCMQLDQAVAIIGHGVNLFGKPGINQGYMCEKKRD